jgi:hypothetical protein
LVHQHVTGKRRVKVEVKVTNYKSGEALEVSRRLRLPEFLDKQQMKVVRLSVLRTGCPYLLAEAPGTDFC